MTTPVGEDLARVTVISTARRMDLALPGSASLGELLPAIVRFAGMDASSSSEAVHTWVLQRFGEDPLDPAKRVSALNLRDGEILHLRQREATMPDAAFDDVVDAVTSSTTSRPSWLPRHSSVAALCCLLAVLIGLPAVAVWRFAATADLTATIVLLAMTALLAVASIVASIVVSRALGRYAVSAALGWSGVALAGLFGYLTVHTQEPTLRALIAAACVLVASGAVWLAAGVHPYGHLAVVLTASMVLVSTMVMVLVPGSVDAVAAIAVALILGATSLMPTLSYQFARIALPNLPATAEALMADDQPVQSDIVARAITADRILAAQLFAGGAGIAILMVPVLARRDWVALGLGAAVCLSLILRSRVFVGLSQRLALLVPGLLIGFATLALFVGGLPPVVGVLVAGVVTVVAAAAVTIYAAAFTAAVVSPVWGRLGDIVEWVAIMAVIPLVLAVLNLYALVQGWAAGR